MIHSKQNGGSTCDVGGSVISINGGTPKSIRWSILNKISLINHPFWGTPYLWKPPCGHPITFGNRLDGFGHVNTCHDEVALRMAQLKWRSFWLNVFNVGKTMPPMKNGDDWGMVFASALLTWMLTHFDPADATIPVAIPVAKGWWVRAPWCWVMSPMVFHVLSHGKTKLLREKNKSWSCRLPAGKKYMLFNSHPKKMEVSGNRGTPKSSIFVGCSLN